VPQDKRETNAFKARNNNSHRNVLECLDQDMMWSEVFTWTVGCEREHELIFIQVSKRKLSGKFMSTL